MDLKETFLSDVTLKDITAHHFHVLTSWSFLKHPLIRGLEWLSLETSAVDNLAPPTWGGKLRCSHLANDWQFLNLIWTRNWNAHFRGHIIMCLIELLTWKYLDSKNHVLCDPTNFTCHLCHACCDLWPCPVLQVRHIVHILHNHTMYATPPVHLRFSASFGNNIFHRQTVMWGTLHSFNIWFQTCMISHHIYKTLPGRASTCIIPITALHDLGTSRFHRAELAINEINFVVGKDGQHSKPPHA